MNRYFILTLVCLLSAPASTAGSETTKQWRQTKSADFEKGVADKVSIRGDGKLMLAPALKEVFDAPSEYIWDLAFDSKGALYAAAGPDAKVFRIAPGGESEVFFENEAVEVHALAVDADDNLYAAVSPGAKIFKISPAGEASLYYETGAAYVWDMVLDRAGTLYVATGDKGEIHRVGPDGEGEVFFESGETHIRSLALDKDGNLIAGADPSGLVLRISPAGEGFVLYQSEKREITAIALADDGSVYAAGVGKRAAVVGPTRSRTARPSTNQGSSAAPTMPGGPAPPNATTPQPTPTTTAAPPLPPVARLSGGSSIVRIAPDGEPREVWSSATDTVYSLGFDSAGKLLIGTGDKGRLLRLESEQLHSLVLKTVSNQITALASGGPGGKTWMAASNIGKVYELGPASAAEGSLESDVLDAKIFSRWGRVEYRGDRAGGSIEIQLRSGNLKSPTRNWSEWSASINRPEGETAQASSSRYAQWRAVLRAGPEGASPTLDSVTVYYRPANLAPRVTEIEMTPPNHRFTPKRATTTNKNLTLAPLGRAQTRRVVTQQASQTMNPAQGYLGVRWAARDPNSDELIARLEIKGEAERAWKLLEDEVEQAYLSWDSTAFADGLYRLRVTLSDRPSNPPSEAKEHARTSEPFLIDNSAPAIENLTAALDGGKLRVRFDAADRTSKLKRAEYSLDGGDWTPLLPVSRLFDSRRMSFDFVTEPVEAGEHVVAVRVTDARDNTAAAKAVIE